jgi:hypothetical protein
MEEHFQVDYTNETFSSDETTIINNIMNNVCLIIGNMTKLNIPSTFNNISYKKIFEKKYNNLTNEIIKYNKQISNLFIGHNDKIKNYFNNLIKNGFMIQNDQQCYMNSAFGALVQMFHDNRVNKQTYLLDEIENHESIFDHDFELTKKDMKISNEYNTLLNRYRAKLVLEQCDKEYIIQSINTIRSLNNNSIKPIKTYDTFDLKLYKETLVFSIIKEVYCILNDINIDNFLISHYKFQIIINLICYILTQNNDNISNKNVNALNRSSKPNQFGDKIKDNYICEYIKDYNILNNGYDELYNYYITGFMTIYADALSLIFGNIFEDLNNNIIYMKNSINNDNNSKIALYLLRDGDLSHSVVILKIHEDYYLYDDVIGKVQRFMKKNSNYYNFFNKFKDELINNESYTNVTSIQKNENNNLTTYIKFKEFSTKIHLKFVNDADFKTFFDNLYVVVYGRKLIGKGNQNNKIIIFIVLFIILCIILIVIIVIIVVIKKNRNENNE